MRTDIGLEEENGCEKTKQLIESCLLLGKARVMRTDMGLEEENGCEKTKQNVGEQVLGIEG
jgi:hypothetical protein